MSGVEDNVALTGIWQPSGPEEKDEGGRRE